MHKDPCLPREVYYFKFSNELNGLLKTVLIIRENV